MSRTGKKLTGDYNYKIVYSSGTNKFTKTNSYSIPYYRAWDEIRDAMLQIDEIGGTVINIELKAVEILA